VNVEGTLEVSVQPPHAAARYALGELLALLGLGARDVPSGEPAAIAYGSGAVGRLVIPAGPREGWDDPDPHLTRRGDLSVVHLAGAPIRPATSDDLGFDALYAAYACLTGVWERADPVDEVGCPVAGDGWLARNGLILEPLVHRYADAIGQLLAQSDIALSPPAREAIVLTHDVDDNFGHLFERGVRRKLLRRDLRARSPGAFRRAAGLARAELARRRHDPNDRFDDWAAWHAGWGSRPTYFVASVGLLRESSAFQDVPYDIRNAHVRETMRRSAADGAEIGVHFSIRARESAERLRFEREELEDAIEEPVESSRHHWWALGIPAEHTLRLQADAGIRVDCSLGFNDGIGFRRGIAAPYRPFDRTTGLPLSLYALPTHAMDAAVQGAASSSEEVAATLGALYEVVRSVNGTLVLDWHVHSANPDVMPGAADGLRAFVRQAMDEGAVLRTPLEVSSASGQTTG
jgi:hypothetical protein